MSLVGFIGVGNMGGPMALNLLQKGVKLIVNDVDVERVQVLKAHGAEVANHPIEVAEAAQVIITMLPNSENVLSVFTGDRGLARNLQPGSICIDSSTIDPSVSVKISEIVAEKGSTFLDAPVSGGVTGAQNATLTFMVGGEPKVFESAKKYFSMMGKNAVHCGKVGSGQAAKICNNMLAGIEMIGVAEAMNLGIKMGLDPKLLSSIINTSSGRCWSSDTYNPVPHIIPGIPSSKGYNGGFASELMAKDLSLAQKASIETKSSTPMGSLAHQIYMMLSQLPEYRSKDFAVVYQFLKDKQGL